MASSPDLFVVCKNCGSQVSPYVTECPYCGNRIRKRAPKIERPPRRPEAGGSRSMGAERRRTRPTVPSLGPLRKGEIPGIRGDETRRPYVTLALVGLGLLWWLAIIPLRAEAVTFIVSPLSEWWSVLTAPFVHDSSWYQFASLGAVGLFGWLLERRHGPVAVLLLWLVAASGGMAAVKAVAGAEFAIGASGGALAFVTAWAVPHLLARRRGADPDDDDADLLGAGVVFALLALMPLARPEVHVVATGVGIVVGALAGLLFARLRPRTA
jgi:membrane associated rhomboid family serine protease/DNA-directed RNA polymerase subunit RPC12/RpoP